MQIPQIADLFSGHIIPYYLWMKTLFSIRTFNPNASKLPKKYKMSRFIFYINFARYIKSDLNKLNNISVIVFGRGMTELFMYLSHVSWTPIACQSHFMDVIFGRQARINIVSFYLLMPKYLNGIIWEFGFGVLY
ncbi:hypothetical protein ACJX0J_017761 [Zea mays]